MTDEPVDMSQFTLGKRYSSEDMYQDMGLTPGSRVSVEIGGVIYTNTVQSVTYKSPAYVPAARRTLWQRFLRRITPKRFRKPLPQPVWGSNTPTYTVEMGPV